MRNKLSITKLLILNLTVFVITSLLFFVFLNLKQHSIIDYFNKIYEHPVTVSKNANEARLGVIDLIDIAEDAMHNENLNSITLVDINITETKIENNLNIVKEQYLGNKADSQNAYLQYLKLKQIIDESMLIAKTKNRQEAMIYFENQNPREIYRLFSFEINKILNFAQDKSKDFVKKAKDESNELTNTSNIVFLVLVFLNALLIFFVARKIQNSFNTLKEFMNSVDSKSYKNIHITNKELKEFFDLKITFNKMFHSIKLATQQIKEQNDELASKNNILNNQTRIIEDANAELDATNEELTATNNALISQARELEEANAELDATNEELAQTNEELAQTNSMLDSERKRYKVIMEFASDAIFIVDKNGKLVDFNKQTQKMLGYQPDELHQLTIFDWDTYLEKEKVFDLLQNGLKEPITFETKHKRKDGTIYDASITAVEIWFENEKYFYASVRDITKEKQIAEQIKDSEVTFKDIFNSVKHTVYIQDFDGTFLDVNDGVYEMYGYTKEEFIGKKPDFTAADGLNDMDMVIKCSIDAINGTPQKFEFWGKRKDGSFFPKEVTLVRGKYFGKDVLIATGTDISARKESEKQLKALIEEASQAEIRKNLALKAATIGIWERDFTTDKLTWDDTVCAIYEIEKHGDTALYNSTWTNAVDKADIERVAKELDFAIKNNSEFNTKFWITTKYGAQKYVHSIGINEYDENGKATRMVGINVDMTTQKHYEEHLQALVAEETQKRITQERLLQQQSKMALMGEMIGNIAHQWRQPLNQISALKDTLVEDYHFGDLTTERLDEYSNQTAAVLLYMSKTIDDFRNFFLPSKEKTIFNLCEIIDRAISIISASLNSHHIKLTSNPTRECANIYGYPNEFAQVIINIINNAKDAILSHNVENGEITVNSIIIENKAIITIEDNAGGIPANILDKIYEPYFTTKFASKGTGLGLYMSKIIIEDSMHGKIFAKNIENGAQFSIELNLRG